MEGKVIVISGGSEGLGKEIAKKLAWKHQVVILSKNQEKLNEASEELKCQGLPCDISNFLSVKATIKAIIEKFGKIDTLINNAGVWMGGEIDDNDPMEIKRTIEVNTLGTTLLTHEVVSHMKQQGGGEIINIISQNGLYGKAGRAVYTASKWAITGLTKSLQEELASYNIKVSGVYPGLMKTNLFDNKGENRDMTTAMEPVRVAELVEYMIGLPEDVLIPEVGIKHIKN
jgi:short-subunit dehydrogenase